jgi:hypothetical protein
LRGRLLEGSRRFAGGCRRVSGDRKRLQTSRRLEPVFGAAPRSSRIDTLKCRETMGRRVSGRDGSWRSKHMRGGRKPNGWIGKPRRGKRSREHRLGRGPNGPRAGTDSRSEQSSEVVGSTPDGGRSKRPFADPDAPLRAPALTPCQRPQPLARIQSASAGRARADVGTHCRGCTGKLSGCFR